MMWQYLEEGGYLHPLFADWYTPMVMNGYVIVMTLNFVFLIVLPFVFYYFSHDKALGDPAAKSWIPLSLRIRWRAFRRLFFGPREFGKFRIFFTLSILAASAAYGVFYCKIVSDPNVLSTGLIQQLSAHHVDRLIDFLYRFAFLGVFFLVVTPVVSFGVFTSVLADQRG